MSVGFDDALPERQMRALVAAGFRDWPSPLQCPPYGAALLVLCDAIDADQDENTTESYDRFLDAVMDCAMAAARYRAAVAKDRQP